MKPGMGGPSGVRGVGGAAGVARAQKPLPLPIKTALLGLYTKIKNGAKFGVRSKVLGGAKPIYRTEIAITQLRLRVLTGKLTNKIVDGFVAMSKKQGLISNGKVIFFVSDKTRQVARDAGTLIAKLATRGSKAARQAKVRTRGPATGVGTRRLIARQQAVAKFAKATKIGSGAYNVTIDVSALKTFARSQPQRIKAKMSAFLAGAKTSNLIRGGKIVYEMRGDRVYSKNTRQAIPSNVYTTMVGLGKVAISSSS